MLLRERAHDLNFKPDNPFERNIIFPRGAIYAKLSTLTENCWKRSRVIHARAQAG